MLPGGNEPAGLMKTIKEPTKNVALLWHRPKPRQVVYRPMKYLLRAEVDDGLLLYNVVTSELVLLDDDERKAFEKLPSLFGTSIDELIARHYAVPEDFDESKSVLQLRALMKKLEPAKRISGYTILPTTECNARCYYCFESDHPRCTMTDKIANDTVAYIAEKCKGEPVEITWFGGEPLLGAKWITQICAGLMEKEIIYKSSIVTNAYLFDKALIETAKSTWKLTNVQITLDGTEEVYNETKAYVRPKDNPYQRVLRNISALLDQKIAVNIRLNVTANNAVNLSKLIDELAERFGGRKGFSGYSHAVYEDVGFMPISYDGDTREWVDVQTKELDGKLRERKLLGSLGQLPRLHLVHCMADGNSSQIIYPDGTIGKCENKSSLEGIGDIYQGITDEAMAARYKEAVQIPGCGDCPLFPDCVNITVCPETGNCTKIKKEWKLNQYTALVKQQYQKHLQDDPVANAEEAGHTECGS